MNEILTRRCDLFIRNRDKIKVNFGWENAYMYPLCASIFTEKGMEVDIDKLSRCRDLLKQKTGIFSNFRGISKLMISSFLALDEHPEQKIDHALRVYDLLKEEFYTSTYLPVAALMMTDFARPEDDERIARRGRQLYQMMKQEHPFLTSREDSIFSVLLALSDLSNEQIIAEMERCYKILKPEFFSGNAVQSLSHVLTLGEASATDKCRRTINLFEVLKNRGCRYGTSYELPALGVLALLDADIDTLANDIAEVNEFLRSQKGFGAFGIGAKQRLMYAGMLVGQEFIGNSGQPAMNMAAAGSAISLVIAQQAAMCAAIAASSSAASSASSSS